MICRRNLLQETRRILRKYGISISKSLGQHFLVDINVINKQISHAEVNKEDVVLEIGCGIGNLTVFLAEKAKKVIGIEVDKRFYKILMQRLSNFNNVKLILNDALKIDLPKVDKVVSNIPYEISSPLTFKLLNSKFKIAVLMYQLEFARRLVATPGTSDYSRLSVGIAYKAECKILEVISKKAFYPQPNVDSALVKIKPRKPSFKVVCESLFFDLIKWLFTNKNKKVKNALKIYFKQTNVNNEYIDKIPGINSYLNIKVRNMSPDQFADLSNKIYEYIRKR